MAKPNGDDGSRTEEAVSLAREAVDAAKQGDADEAKFLADAARELDGDAAGKVIKQSGTGKTIEQGDAG